MKIMRVMTMGRLLTVPRRAGHKKIKSHQIDEIILSGLYSREGSYEVWSHPTIAVKYKQCSQCCYHDYDEYSNDDGSYDEFEVCRKGHDLDEGVCSDYEEL